MYSSFSKLYFQFREQSTLTSVAQAVVDKVVRQHHDWYMSSSLNNRSMKREDITLLVRNFNYELPSANKTPTNQAVSFNPIVVSNTLTSQSTMMNTESERGTYNSNIASTTSSVQNDTDNEIGEDNRIDAYVDFSVFYQNYEIAKNDNALPSCLEF